MILKMLFSRQGAWLAGVLALCVLIVGLRWQAYQAGAEAGRVAQMREAVEAYQKREDIDNEVHGMGAVRLCIDLGGVPDECEQLRGMEADRGEAGDGGISGRE